MGGQDEGSGKIVVGSDHYGLRLKKKQRVSVPPFRSATRLTLRPCTSP